MPVLSTVGLAACVPPCPLGNLYSFTLALTSCFVIVTRSLKGKAQQHILARLKHDARNAGAVRHEVG